MSSRLARVLATRAVAQSRELAKTVLQLESELSDSGIDLGSGAGLWVALARRAITMATQFERLSDELRSRTR